MTKKICIKTLFRVLVITAFLSASVLTAAAAVVSVSAEATYTNTNLVVMIYADIDATDSDPLVSSGVKLTYTTAELSNPVADKNEAIWYFGDGTNNFPYFAPDVSTAGEVVFILGRLDTTENPQSGVSGNGVLLGTITFDRTTSDVPVADPATLFGLTIDLGRDRTTYPAYVNFASLAGVDLDTLVTFNVVGYSFTPSLVGDLNGDCVVDMRDYGIFRANYGATGANPADLNSDGVVDMRDYGIFRANYGQTCPE